MKRIATLCFISLMSVLLVQCTAKKTATTEMSPEQAVADVKKHYTEAQMQEGKVLFEAKCDKCHGLKEPESRNVAKWERVLPRMSKKAELSDEEAGKVRAYVLAHAPLS